MVSEPEYETGNRDQPAPGIFFIGCVNGAFLIMSNALLDPETVLPAFAMRIMEGNVLWVGLIYAVLQAGPFWPQVFLSRSMETARRLLPYYHFSLLMRMAGILGAAVVIYFLAQTSPVLAFILVVVALFIAFSFVSFGLIPFIEIVNQKVPRRLRGRFFSLRYTAAGLAAFAGGFLVKDLLNANGGLEFPVNYAVVFAAGAASLAVALAAFAFIKDEGRKPASRQLNMRMHLARGSRMLRENSNLRRLGKGRMLGRSACALAFPFVVPYALKMLQMPEAAVGLLLSAKMLTYSLSNLLWSYISERWGNRAVVITSTVALMAVPVVTMVAAYLPETQIGVVTGIGITGRLLAIIIAAVLMGASLSGALVGFKASLLDILPDRKRTTFVGCYYLLLLPTAVVPVLAALIVGENNFLYAMVLALVVGTLSLIEVLRLQDFRAEGASGEMPEAAK